MMTMSKLIGSTALSAAAILALTGELSAKEGNRSSCPWIVLHDEQLPNHAVDKANYDIFFTGKSRRGVVFYGFTVTDPELAFQLSQEGAIHDLEENARSLEVVDQDGPSSYRVAADSVVPRTIYLLASTERVPPLETIDAQIDPARSVTIGIGPARGASDFNGPLPRRTVPGRPIVSPSPNTRSPQLLEDESAMLAAYDQDMQLCAYQISWR